MADERSATIKIGNKEYELLLSTKATKEIAKRYGGIENIGSDILEQKEYGKALEELIWLVVLLANQPILAYNLQNPTEKKDLLTEEEVEILTTPQDFVDFKEALGEALYRGTKRNIESEPGKNVDNG